MTLGGKFFAVFTADIKEGETYVLSRQLAVNIAKFYLYLDKIWGTGADTVGMPKIFASSINNPSFTATYTGTLIIGVYSSAAIGNTVSITGFQLELGSTATAYEPYISNQQTITLPSDHNYLASLPDGTRDELVLRSDGVAVLTERVGKVVFDGSADEAWADHGAAVSFRYRVQVSGAIFSNISGTAPNIICSHYQVLPWAVTDKTQGISASLSGGISVSFRDTSITTLADWRTVLAANPVTVYYEIATPVTSYSSDNGATWSTTNPADGTSAIQLYKGTNNVWCTDPLSPEVSLDYVQDTNAVIEKLSAAIVAAGSIGV